MNIETDGKLGEVAIKSLTTFAALAVIQDEVKQAGEFGDRYEGARDTLFEAFELLGEFGILAKPENGMSITICERDGAMLFVWGTEGLPADKRLIHVSFSGGKLTAIQDEHEYQGGLGSIVVDGFEWCWQEMVEGVFKAADRLGLNAQVGDDGGDGLTELPRKAKLALKAASAASKAADLAVKAALDEMRGRVQS